MKTLVNVTVPALNENYDIFIPEFISIKELTVLIAQAIKEISNKKYMPSGNEFLCHKDRNILLDKEATVELYDIKNGDNLILI